MSEDQACLIAQNILNSLDSSPPAPASSLPAYAEAPALCVTNTVPLSPQVLAALVSHLRTGSKSLLIRTVEVCPKQKCTEESVEDMVIRSVEALFAEASVEVKPVEAFAEVSFEVKPRDDDKPAYAESSSDTRALSHNDLGHLHGYFEDIVITFENSPRTMIMHPCLMNLIMNPMILIMC